MNESLLAFKCPNCVFHKRKSQVLDEATENKNLLACEGTMLIGKNLLHLGPSRSPSSGPHPTQHSQI